MKGDVFWVGILTFCASRNRRRRRRRVSLSGLALLTCPSLDWIGYGRCCRSALQMHDDYAAENTHTHTHTHTHAQQKQKTTRTQGTNLDKAVAERAVAINTLIAKHLDLPQRTLANKYVRIFTTWLSAATRPRWLNLRDLAVSAS